MRENEKTAAERKLKQLKAWAQRLAEVVETATRTASDAHLRREGARFGEVLEEWAEEVAELIDTQDETAGERLESFQKRLNLAERKVRHWNLPPQVIAALERGKEQTTDRRRAGKRKAA
jgi:hypothetical protein